MFKRHFYQHINYTNCMTNMACFFDGINTKWIGNNPCITWPKLICNLQQKEYYDIRATISLYYTLPNCDKSIKSISSEVNRIHF